MRPPSGDQTGVASSTGSNVNRPAVSPSRSITQKSTFDALASGVSAATRRPSGDSDGLNITPGRPAVPSSFPLRSYQVSTDCEVAVLGLTTTVPMAETVKAPQYNAV